MWVIVYKLISSNYDLKLPKSGVIAFYVASFKRIYQILSAFCGLSKKLHVYIYVKLKYDNCYMHVDRFDKLYIFYYTQPKMTVIEYTFLAIKVPLSVYLMEFESALLRTWKSFTESNHHTKHKHGFFEDVDVDCVEV